MNKAADTSSGISVFSSSSAPRDEPRPRHERDADRAADELGVRIVADLIEIALEEHAHEACNCTPVATPKVSRYEPSRRSDSSQVWISASGGDGIVAGPQTTGYAHGALRVALTRDNITEFILEVNSGHSVASPNAKLSRAIDGISLLFAEASVRYSITSPNTFLGAYIFGGMGYGLQWWGYRGGGSDAVDGVDLFGGAGVNVIQTSHFRLGLEARPGLIIWMPRTMNGYDNDVFGAMTYVKVGPAISVRF
jgi:hypothetical protein